MSKKKRSRKKKFDEILDLDSDGTFCFIAGYTSWGFPYGVMWEQTFEDECLDESEQLPWMTIQEEFEDDEIPF